MKITCSVQHTEKDNIQVVSVSACETNRVCGETFTIELQDNGNANDEGNSEILLPKYLNFQYNTLSSIVLTHCNMNYLPFCTYFENLLLIDLSNNKLRNVPHWIINRELKLQVLNLSGNIVNNFDSVPKCSKHLVTLDISSNKIREVPFWIFGSLCPNLELLDMSHNPIRTYLPFLTGRFLRKLRNLKINNFNSNLHIIKYIHEIPNLNILSVGNHASNMFLNTINELHFKLYASASTIIELDISGVGLSTVADDIYLLKSVQKLNLSHNCISWLPDNITKLKSLRILDVSHNDLTGLPANVGRIKCLTEIYISNNYVGSLPDSLLLLENLHTIDCYCNELMEKDVEVLNKIKNLTALDLEQNLFEAGNDENYIKKRQKLRNDYQHRIIGPKQKEFYSSPENSHTDSASNYEGENVTNSSNENENENWDCNEDDDCKSDNSLVLPPYKFVTTRKENIFDASDHIDPTFFEDSLDDHT